ncbi:MAG TPA: hypothetical protein VFW45_06270 [Candidatus Polarisedimenticolia bacterium]|nr:hypothetical protein [Candidatus Polarisedimenticolia bacterium]
MLNRGARRMVVLVLVLLSLSAGPARITLVVCSPGSPGDTAQAQPTMDQLAGALAQTAGWPADSLAAVYFETSAGGGQRLEQGDAPAALVSLPFYYEYARALSLVPALEAVPESGAGAVYRLVARSGALKSPATLADWEIVGGIGFSPDFVRREVLAGWGPIPDSARISFSARPLSALRRAASGEKIAVLLDPEQSAALPSLPFSSDLETVATSREFPGGIFCLVKGRLPEARAASLVDALRKLGSSETGKAALQAIRIREFRAIDLKRIPAAVSGTNSSHP